MKFVALIRGINVGGSSVIRMDELKRIFELAGAENVSTHIQSGNVIFDAIDRAAFQKRIEKKLEMRTKRPATVFILSAAELRRAITNDPFVRERDSIKHRYHLVFLSKKPKPEAAKKLKTMEGKEYTFEVKEKILYMTYPKQYDGKRRTIDFEKVLGVRATARTSAVADALLTMLENK